MLSAVVGTVIILSIGIWLMLWMPFARVRKACLDVLGQESYDDIHQLHSNQHPDTWIEPARSKGNDLASADGHYTKTHNYRPACARTGLAASRRTSLVVQKIYRIGGARDARVRF